MRHNMSYETFWAVVVLALLAILPSTIRYTAKQFALAQNSGRGRS